MFISASLPRLGLALGLGFSSFSCTGGEGDSTSTVADSQDSQDSQEADAVTYAGPDSFTDVTTDTPPGDGTTTTTNSDSSEADAVTYAGPDETTSIGDVTTIATDTDTSPGSTTDTGETCVPITEDASGIGSECAVDGDCPAGYTCQPFAGIVLEMSCQVLCEQTCECPAGLSCIAVADKSGASWNQCSL